MSRLLQGVNPVFSSRPPVGSSSSSPAPFSLTVVSAQYATGVGVAVNDLVYVDGSGSVDKADANGSGTFPAIGFVISKPTTTQAIVQFMGELDGFSGLTLGQRLFMSETPGQVVDDTALPTSSGAAIQPVAVVRTSSIIAVLIHPDFTLLS